jgi:hypothetical protein
MGRHVARQAEVRIATDLALAHAWAAGTAVAATGTGRAAFPRAGIAALLTSRAAGAATRNANGAGLAAGSVLRDHAAVADAGKARTATDLPSGQAANHPARAVARTGALIERKARWARSHAILAALGGP